MREEEHIHGTGGNFKMKNTVWTKKKSAHGYMFRFEDGWVKEFSAWEINQAKYKRGKLIEYAPV